MNGQIKVRISEEEVNARIAGLAAQISEDFRGEEVVAVGILRGGVYSISAASDTLPLEGVRW